jgi:hypothetical protein
MPLGNGDIGLNVWVEENGDLLFYIGKTDAWCENARLLKLARVRIHLHPNPFISGLPFRQTLRLGEGEIEIVAGEEIAPLTLRIWVDANAPIVHVEAESEQAFELQAHLETWRTETRVLGEREVDSAFGQENGPQPVTVTPDTILSLPEGIAWYHRNETSLWPQTMQLQGLASLIEEYSDPLLHRTFGGMIYGSGLEKSDDLILRSKTPQRRYDIEVFLLTAQTKDGQEWQNQLLEIVAQGQTTDNETARQAHREWWREFWERSWIFVSGDEDAECVTRGYILQRFINACGGRGAQPIKFNGSIFNVDAREPDEHFDADYRRWGGPYWFQNTRLTYWPMLPTGDYDLMQPFFRMYRDALALACARTSIYFGHEGACFPETMHFWGTYANSNYGWEREGRPVSYVAGTYIRHYWSGMLELLAMALEYFAFTDDREFLQSTLLPLADAILDFYDQHYDCDENGRIRFEPAMSLETWHRAVNPLPEIAGLQWTLESLLNLPQDAVGAQRIERWSQLREQLPELPTEKRDGQTILLPAQEFDDRKNSENPELYAIFPYRLFGVGRLDLEVGRATFTARRVQGTGGWRQDAIQAALLGLTETAREYVVQNFSHSHEGSRFPAFWGPNFDWIPDQDHGGVAMIALQKMLMQTVDERVLLFPAWPRNWDVEFRLHAPQQTTVEGVYRDGKLLSLCVTPQERAADVE